MARHGSDQTATGGDNHPGGYRIGNHEQNIHNDNQLRVDQIKDRLASEQARQQGDLSSMDEGGR